MPYVVPNSEAQFFINTGLSPSHENSLYFESITAKDAYFDGRNKYTVSEVTYQRENRGFIRVQLPISNLIRCDYMRFKNSSFETQWFYAFITQVNYINNLTTEVQYVLDPLITWMGWFNLKQCYIARQHTVNDGIGNNIAEEGLPVGNYICENVHILQSINQSNVMYRLNVADGGSLATHGGIPSGSTVYDCETIVELENKINELVSANQADSIIGISAIAQAYKDGMRGYDFEYNKPYSSVGGYKPKNNKLYCYPYKYCTIDNTEGATQDYMYEYFDTVPSATSSGTYKFTMEGCDYPDGTQMLVLPLNYMRSTDMPSSVIPANPEYRITQSHFPVGSYAVDSYKAYLAQKNAYFPQEIAMSAGEGMIHVGTGALKGTLSGLNTDKGVPDLGKMLTGTIVGAGNAAINTMDDLATKAMDNMIENKIRPLSPSISHGTPSSDIMFSTYGKNIYIYEKTITKNYAQMIDDYFTMYGYAIKQVMKPNMNARPHWTYLKTIGCNVDGAFPSSDARAIEAIFDNGVRLWHNLDEMGNYSLDNSPS